MSQPIEKSVTIRCSVEHAFQTFTRRVDLWWPPGHRKFSESELRLEGREGGRLVEVAAAGDEFTIGVVTSWEPPRLIRLNWYPGADANPTRVELRFEPQGDDCLVAVLHGEGESELGDKWPTRAALFTRGWTHVLAAFSVAAGNGRPVAVESRDQARAPQGRDDDD